MEGPVPLDAVIVAAPSQLSTAFDEEVVILGLRDSVYYGLTGVGTRIWALLQSPRTLREIVDAIVSEYAVSAEDASRDLQALVAQLHVHGLVDLQPSARA